VLGVLVARAAGEPFDEVLRTRVFEPLGMRDTAFWTSETDRLTTAYTANQDDLKAWDEPDGLWSRPPAFFAPKSWGFCQAVYDTGAFGWNGGFGTSWLVDPARDLTVIVLTQLLFESAELPPAHRDIQAAAYAAVA
jgi:CubicO group peptidase (beta-lactamase class C family)